MLRNSTIFAVSISLFVFAGWANAGAEIDIRGNFCHFLQDYENPDKEIFVAGCDGQVFPDGEGGAIGWAKFIRYPVVAGVEDILVSGIDNVPCVLVDSNGTEYHSYSYLSHVFILNYKINYSLYCFDGVQQ